MAIYVGTAAWNIPKAFAEAFPAEGSHLERYAQRLTGVEINSSFYRPHQPKTYARWAESVPDGFRFAVKVPKEITHLRRLVGVETALEAFLDETASLGEKRGPLLVQLPPSLVYDEGVVEDFFATLRARHAGPVVVEPRHRSWFTPEAEGLLVAFRIGRVAADPARVPEAAMPGGFGGVVYYRWHGSPKMYESEYSEAAIATLADRLGRYPEADEVWCIFDNTTFGAATGNALDLSRRLHPAPTPSNL